MKLKEEQQYEKQLQYKVLLCCNKAYIQVPQNQCVK